MDPENEHRCCEAVIRIVEQREDSVREILSVDTPKTPGVEIQCSIAGRTYALEHTSLDPYPDRRSDDHRFLEVMGPLTKSLNAAGLPTDRRFRLLTDIHAFRHFKRRDFPKIRERLESWTLANQDLRPRNQSRAAVIWGRPPAVPVRAMLQCFYARGVLKGRVTVGRLAPEDVEDLRLERIRAAIASKGPKLQAEHRAGATSVLVLENSEVALSNHILIAQAVNQELARFDYPIDEIYLVETDSADEWLVHTLKLGGRQWPTETDAPPLVAFSPAALSAEMPT